MDVLPTAAETGLGEPAPVSWEECADQRGTANKTNLPAIPARLACDVQPPASLASLSPALTFPPTDP